MNRDRLGEKQRVRCGHAPHTVMPRFPVLPTSTQGNTTPGKSPRRRPRCRSYQRRSRSGSEDLKKTPPIPVPRPRRACVFVLRSAQSGGPFDSAREKKANSQIPGTRSPEGRKAGDSNHGLRTNEGRVRGRIRGCDEGQGGAGGRDAMARRPRAPQEGERGRSHGDVEASLILLRALEPNLFEPPHLRGSAPPLL